ncbi:uncharacterized protein EI90DRAFT_3063219 [Cantharellus anzutake]|uniref:uncharacterized protein n=1 Tax=Cantharellus anzutake TaxID=1750568 RepID=UPI001908068F|nr:uncharacterized protein EI90DRAFT_3063219 [Cantharellus anzutake]KAF8329113.1 hypothetical protein EI90DRAFT_3063219 [Cantharellus anzutake]
MDDDFLTQALSNLPRTSAAFSRVKNVSLSVVDVDPTTAPPRKFARTEQDHDTNRNKGKGRARAQDELPGKGLELECKVQVLRVGGMLPTRALPLEYTNRLSPLVTRSVRAILDAKAMGGNRIAPFEELFQAVRVLVSLQGHGEDLYGDVKIALEKCVDAEFRKLMTMPLGDMKWLSQLVQVWQWYESRLVRRPSPAMWMVAHRVS